MANLKELRTKKVSVENTKKVTQAMQLLSAIKSKKLLGTLAQRENYIHELKNTIGYLLSQGVKIDHPLVKEAPTEKVKMTFMVIGTNRGFVGSLLPRLADFVRTEIAKHDAVELIGVKPTATKVFGLIGKKQSLLFDEVCDENVFELAGTLKQVILERIATGESTHISLLYTSFHSFSQLIPTILSLAPLALDISQQETLNGSFTFDTAPEEILRTAIEAYLEATISHALLSAAVSEYAARMLAMHKAKENAEQVLAQTNKAYNKARQSAITTQIQEISNTQLSLLSA
jgi:F-type H+-transporting ATPase subunit gamma